MSEQTNPTTNQEDETAAVVESPTPEAGAGNSTPATATSEASTPNASSTERAAAPTQRPAAPALREETRSAGPRRERSFDDDDDDDFDDDDDEYSDDYSDEDEELYVDGPAQYVQRERGGRGRRIGNDIRVTDIDYKNVPLLSRFLDRRGRILSRRRTRVSAKVQRRIVTAIKRARHLALLPYTGDHTRIVRKRR